MIGEGDLESDVCCYRWINDDKCVYIICIYNMYIYIFIHICILAETELFLQGCFGHTKGYYLTALLGMFQLRPGVYID